MTPSSIRLGLLSAVFGAALVLGACSTDGTPVAGDDTRTPTRTSGPETSSPETSSPETSSPETSSPETSSPETSSPESSSPEPPTDSGSGGSGLSTEKENEVFLQTLEQLNVDVPDKDKYIKVGRQACTDIRGGKSFIDIALNSPLGLGPVQSGSVVGAAIGVFCPDQQSKISAGG
ncbi:DUF732 domain-containing protein [Gordonia sp. (in: high G+C Gram-positive bacteria)]|uniref:DUF732 domain-containing protein n=2 Tax=Gordonia sp. (in: high G+C Gram-positive bacteria) TaxID=84139 RepID=UPI00261A59AC|nr:DUF732 domain-containing protein [Gordonia sp. (in: high G+C Gram-positive bacteria)]HMS75301.1 DUF732 domain-containing protein [Gordonia sp. (in: high G+C Gram-positive bacteria)]HQV20365.1 DUF732 domain-containing protein [Gordonia sp. (in: high G+C Gram-positive bacteria)]